MTQANAHAYWRANLRLLAWILAIWFFVSFGCGIVLADFLNTWSLGGYPLGFWFAQQGSLYTFVVLIFFYAWRMNRLDRRFGLEETDREEDGSQGEGR